MKISAGCRFAATLSLLISSWTYGITTAYVSFEHPEGWKCELSQGVWICQSVIEPDRKESIVLSIAATATEWDTLDNYEQYLKKSRPIETEDGKQIFSSVRYVRRRTIRGHDWIDSLQKDSELPGFWARYLATIHQTNKAKLAVLISYIVSEESYAKMSPEFEKMVTSLKLNDQFDLNVKGQQKNAPLPGTEILGAPNTEVTKEILKERLKRPEVAPSKAPSFLLEIGVIGLLLLIYLYLRFRHRKQKR